MRYRVSMELSEHPTVNLSSFTFVAINKREALKLAVRELRKADFSGVFRLERFVKKNSSWCTLLDRYGSTTFDTDDFHWVSD